jgi:hypothetical protein
VSTSPQTCPVCGADVPTRAKACPECGADERSGWNEDDTRYDGLDLPDSAFEDEDTPPRRAPKTTPSIFWWVVAVGLLLVMAVLAIAF